MRTLTLRSAARVSASITAQSGHMRPGRFHTGVAVFPLIITARSPWPVCGSGTEAENICSLQTFLILVEFECQRAHVLAGLVLLRSVFRTGLRNSATAARRTGRHCGQVPGLGSTDRNLFNRNIKLCGRAMRNGVPLTRTG